MAVIFYSPHADDSLLSMSVDILNHIDAGKDVYVVLMTLGGSEAMRDVLNGNKVGFGEPQHDVFAEMYHKPHLNVDDIKAIRRNEFISEVGQYKLYAQRTTGVSVKGEIWGLNEGLSQQSAYDIMKEYARVYPGSSHKTMSYTDRAPDHANCGKALQQLKTEGAISDARFYVHREYRYDAGVLAKRPWPVYATESQKPWIDRAARAYKAWNPAGGSYSYGYISVKDSFDTLAADPHSLVHA